MVLIFTNYLWSTEIAINIAKSVVKLTIKIDLWSKSLELLDVGPILWERVLRIWLNLRLCFIPSFRYTGWKSKWWRIQRKNVLLGIIKCIPMCFWVLWFESHSHIEAYNPSVLKNGCMLGVSSDIWFKKCDITSPTMWHKFVTRLHCTS